MGAGDEIARDEESDAVVQQLEKGLPRWGGPGEDGWWTGSEGGSERWVEIVMAVKGHKDVMWVYSVSIVVLVCRKRLT